MPPPPHAPIHERGFREHQPFDRWSVVSSGGALIDRRGHAVAADAFHLLIEDGDLIVPCRVIHHADERIGVSFNCPPSRASRWQQADAKRDRSAVHMMLEPKKNQLFSCRRGSAARASTRRRRCPS